jgi:hypothetical protein
MIALLLAGLTVPEVAPGCPDAHVLSERLRALGVEVRDDDDVRVRFSLRDGRRVALIEMPPAEPRRLEHEGPDCASLADATVSLLSVLLDERAAPVPPVPPVAPAPAPPRAAYRADAGVALSGGIVAPLAAGLTLGVARRLGRRFSLGLAAETWPARDEAVGAGAVSVSASTLAVAGCVGPALARLTLEGCVLAHGGFYSLSATGFPSVHRELRALFGGEADVRAALPITARFGVFARAGAWIPLTRLDVTVRGAGPGFTTTSFGPKAAFGLEANF